MATANQTDIDYTHAVLTAFFANEIIAKNNITDRVIDLTGQMIEDASDCTQLIEMVPRPVSPTGAKPAVSWALKYIRQLGKSTIRNPGKISLICRRRVALGYKHRLLMSIR